MTFCWNTDVAFAKKLSDDERSRIGKSLFRFIWNNAIACVSPGTIGIGVYDSVNETYRVFDACAIDMVYDQRRLPERTFNRISFAFLLVKWLDVPPGEHPSNYGPFIRKPQAMPLCYLPAFFDRSDEIIDFSQAKETYEQEEAALDRALAKMYSEESSDAS